MRRREDAPRNDAFTKMEDGCDSQDETGERPRRQAGGVRASHPLHSSACANTPCHNNVHMRPPAFNYSSGNIHSVRTKYIRYQMDLDTKEVITANRCGVEVMQTLQCPVHRYGTVQRSTPSVRSHFVSGPCYTSHQHHPFLLRRSFPLECHSRPPHVLGFNN